MHGKLFRELACCRSRGCESGETVHLFIAWLFGAVPAHVEHLVILLWGLDWHRHVVIRGHNLVTLDFGTVLPSVRRASYLLEVIAKPPLE